MREKEWTAEKKAEYKVSEIDQQEKTREFIPLILSNLFCQQITDESYMKSPKLSLF